MITDDIRVLIDSILSRYAEGETMSRADRWRVSSLQRMIARREAEPSRQILLDADFHGRGVDDE